MTFGKNKSKIRKRKYVKTATRSKIVYFKTPKKLYSCISCGSKLQAVSFVPGIAKNQKRPNRPFGGTLCYNCVRDSFKAKARSI
ncbi:MAG: hypothetical protein EPN86_01490 [Nanoarchaeota archaeon]|nr:MAG: hypothetical protein EPN86_01490 [Nanoarchaeota archaeon]